MASSTVLTRTLRRTLLDSRYSLPPTFLLPWTAGLHIDSSASGTIEPLPSTLQPSTSSTQQFPSRESQISSSATSQLRRSAIDAKTAPPQLSQSVKDLLPLLRAQGQVYVAAHIHGKAYILTRGDTLRLPFRMPDVEVGDTLRLNCALYLGSRDFTLKPAAAKPAFSGQTLDVEVDTVEQPSAATDDSPAPHFIPHLAQGKYQYLDERLFLCRALVIGVESEPLRILEKTKRRQRHVKHVKSKHRYTILKISDLQVRSLQEIESGEAD